jgi:hypothetical protein
MDVRLSVDANLIVDIDIRFVPEEVPDWLSTSKESFSIIESQISVLKKLTERNNELMGFNVAAEFKHKELASRMLAKSALLKKLKEDLTCVHRTLLKMKKKLKLS